MAASELAQRLEMKDSDQLLARQNTHENRSDFARMAAQVGRQIATTAAKLEQLTKCILVVDLSVHFISYSGQEEVAV